jgi:hypothetical protein
MRLFVGIGLVVSNAADEPVAVLPLNLPPVRREAGNRGISAFPGPDGMAELVK